MGSAVPWEQGPGLIESAWRFKWLIVAATVVAMLAGYGASLLQPTMYEAEARLLLTDPRTAGVFQDSQRISIDPSRYVRNQAQYVESRAVAVKTIELLDGSVSVDEVDERVTARASVDLDLITIRASAPEAGDAAELANAVGEAYQSRVREEVQAHAQQAITELDASKQDLQQRISAAERGLAGNPDNSALRAERDAAIAQLITIESRADQIAVDAALYGSGVELFEEAEVPEVPAQPKPLRNAAVAGVLGLMAAAALAWWRAERTQSAEGRDDPARVLGAPLLGEIPEFSDVGADGPSPTVTMPHSVAAEAYQFVVASLQFALAEHGGSSVVITSAAPGDGKTATALNLAAAAVQDGRRVLLVDGDERMRGLTKLSGLSPDPGLTDLQDENLPFSGCVSEWRLSERVALPFVTAGSELRDPAGFFRTPGFRRAIRRIKDYADFTIVDSPPILAVADSSAIASQVDGIVVVVQRGTPLRLLEDVAQRLAFVGTPVLGYVFNRAKPRSRRYGRTYGAGYGYGYGHQADTAAAPANGNANGARHRRSRSVEE